MCQIEWVVQILFFVETGSWHSVKWALLIFAPLLVDQMDSSVLECLASHKSRDREIMPQSCQKKKSFSRRGLCLYSLWLGCNNKEKSCYFKLLIHGFLSTQTQKVHTERWLSVCVLREYLTKGLNALHDFQTCNIFLKHQVSCSCRLSKWYDKDHTI